eukprot:1196058-Prorocentrum_minimum.AAC.11
MFVISEEAYVGVGGVARKGHVVEHHGRHSRSRGALPHGHPSAASRPGLPRLPRRVALEDQRLKRCQLRPGRSAGASNQQLRVQ